MTRNVNSLDHSAVKGRFTAISAALLLVVGLGACTYVDEAPYVERSVEELYDMAMRDMNRQYYDDAAASFEEIERQHPYSSWATKAQLMAAYAYYLANDYTDAIGALDRFIQLHPANKDVPYAYYLKGLSYYEQISDVARDQKMTAQAQETFRELVARYPQSKYARDARIKLELTHDHLAGKEMDIGRWYHERGHYLAAINRFKVVVSDYQTTTHVPEALHRLVECYEALGLKQEAARAASVLGHNFPGSEWYIDSYELIENVQIRSRDDPTEPWYVFW